MKNLPLLLGTAALSLASFFAAVSAEPSVYRYSALKRDKTDYAAIAAGCPNKAIPSDYYTYLQATTYREQDLQRSGDALRLFPWENPIIFDPVASGTHLRPFIDSLYIKEPIPGDSTQYFSLESHFSCHTKPGSSSLTMQGVHLTPICPTNPKISGAVSDPIEGLGNARVQILYAFQDENGSELLLNTTQVLATGATLPAANGKKSYNSNSKPPLSGRFRGQPAPSLRLRSRLHYLRFGRENGLSGCCPVAGPSIRSGGTSPAMSFSSARASNECRTDLHPGRDVTPQHPSFLAGDRPE